MSMILKPFLSLQGSKTSLVERNTTDLVSSGTAIDHGTLDNMLDEGHRKQRHRYRLMQVAASQV